MKDPKHFWALFILSWAIIAVGQEEEPQDEEKKEFVIDLGEENFDSTIEANPLILVEFYAPWCGHCKQLAPEYERAAEILDAINVPLAKVDATEHAELATRFGVAGYPTLKVFHDGVAYDYEGPRSSKGIVDYMQKENSPDWTPPPEYVLVLTADSFTDTIENSALILVEFYAPWCGHCKSLEPQYKKAAEDLHKSGVQLAKVDATVETELAKQYEVKGYPMLMMFRNGVQYDYNGPRDRQGIVSYMLEQNKPPFLEVSSYKELKRKLKSDSPPVILLCAEDMLSAFYDLANNARESFLHFRHSSSASVCADVGLEMGTAAIVIPYFYRSKDQPWLIPVDLVEADFPSVLKAARPLVAIRTKVTSEAWYSEYPMLVGYLDYNLSEDKEDFQFWREKLLVLAHKYPQLTVAISNEKEYEQELNQLGISDRGDEVTMVIWAGLHERYVMEDGQDFVEFIDDYLAGELKPFILSQPKPKKDKGPVVTVVGSTFREIVLDTSKHVFIDFYAPWCKECTELEPKLKELAKKFKKNSDIVIAKFDATANDASPQFEIPGYPTLFLVKAGTNEVISYKQQREVKPMVKFIKKLTKKSKDEL